MPRVMLLCFVVLSVGCVSTQDRPMNKSEKTVLSEAVAEIVAEDQDGIVDIREHKQVRCTRFKRVGTHMVTRHCYTIGEEEESQLANQNRMRDRFGKMDCLDQTLSGACSNAALQDPFAGLPGRNPGGGPR